jgi:GNAT superfamily N-acetyltransferase
MTIHARDVSVCRAHVDDPESITTLIEDVFTKCVAPDYSREGRDFFLGLCSTDKLKETIQNGNLIILVAKRNEEIVGTVWVRDGNHIARFFVKTKHQGNGIGRKLFTSLVREVKMKNTGIDRITVNSSPFAIAAYEALGFEKTDGEKSGNGMRYIPMACRLT